MEAWKWGAAAIAAAVLVVIGWRWFVKRNFRTNRRKYGFEGQKDAVTLHELLSRIEVEEQWMRSERARLSAWLRALSRPRFEDMTPVQVVGAAESTEIQALRQITELDSSDPKALVDNLRSIGSNSLAQFVRFFTRSDPDEVDVPYEVLLQDACKHLGARPEPGAGIYSLELALQKKAFEKLVSAMPAGERERFLAEFAASTREPSLGKEALVGGGIVAANLSGFGLYLASSTALGAITSAIGVTLPFAVYTGMSSTLAVLIGPVGWVALGGWVLHKLGKPDPNKVVAGTLLIANVRQRLIAKRDEPIPYINHDLGSLLPQFNKQLAAVRARVQSAERYRLSDGEPVDRHGYQIPPRPSLSSDAKKEQAARPLALLP
jgi:uncharacterized protein YaaW (UPF0174 family)